MEYITYRTAKGFKVVGKIHQDLDTFRMPVDVKIDTEGNPEIQKDSGRLAPLPRSKSIPLAGPSPTELRSIRTMFC